MTMNVVVLVSSGGRRKISVHVKWEEFGARTEGSTGN